MDKNTNALNWFEMSVTNLPRARKFYETIFGILMEEQEMAGLKMAYFPGENGNGKLSGCLAKSDMHTPSMEGTVVYFNGNPDLSDALSLVEAAGGKVLMPKTKISDEIGYMAFIADTEGNKVGLHSQK